MPRLLVVAFAVIACVVTTRAESATPEQFINELAQQAIAVSAQNAPQQQKVAQFRALLNRGFDVPLIGKFVLGRYWPKATDAEKAEYLKLFEDYIVRSYAKRFEAYQGEQLQVLGSRQDANGALLVGTVMQRPGGGEPVRIEWQVQPAGGSYNVVDVVVEGVSMGVTQRSEFSSVIRRGGGDVATIIDALKKILAQLQS